MLRSSLLRQGAIIFALTWSIQAPASTEPPTIEDAVPIPLAEIGQRVDAQQPTAAPVLRAGEATLAVPLQALNGTVGPDGLTVESTSASEGTGSFRMTPTTLSKGGAPTSVVPGVVTVQGTAVVLDRGVLTEVFTASTDGIRQDFMVREPPAGASPLTLTLALEGIVAGTVPNGIGLTLPGGRQLIYHRLHITDADGQVLAGSLTSPDPQTLTITVADAAARYPITIDPTITDADWQMWNPGLPGAYGSVHALAYDAIGGKLYVGGNFNAIGAILANYIAQWDGSAWSALGSGLSSAPFALALSGGALYAGGLFSSAGGVAVNNIAKWDGSTWSALGSGTSGANGGTIWDLAVSGTDLYAGGYFTNAGGVAANNIAKWNGSTWSTLGSGMNSEVRALAVSGTDVYAGGPFTSAAGVPNTSHIAKWNGSAWSAMGTGMDDWVTELVLSGTDLYAGGWFTSAGGVAADRIARWNGSTWSALGTGIDGHSVDAIAVSGTDLYVAGYFYRAGSVAADHIAKWNGSTWSALGSGMDGGVSALAVADTDLYAGGGFQKAGGTEVSNIARWSISGSTWSAMGSGMNGSVQALAVSNADIYVGGYFTSAGEVAANRIAKWDGSVWSALGSGLSAAPSALAVSGTDLYAGGNFTTAGGIAAKYVAKWNGSTWSALGSGTNGDVRALAVSGSDLYAGGSFTTAGVGSANRIAKWNGSSWSTLGSGMNGSVQALAVSGSDLYVGGSFTTAGEVAADRIARWDGSTSTWSGLGSGINGSIQALAVSGSDLYVGGSFTTAGEVAANRIARWDGSSWSTLGSGLSGAPFALALSGSDLYAGGDLTTAGGNAVKNIARWDGSVWSALGSGTIGRVSALAISGNDLYVGGSFITAGGKLSPYAASVNLPACGSGIAYTTGVWQMLAMPCVPAGGTVAGTFGAGTLTDLKTPYGVADPANNAGWVFFDRAPAATDYRMLGSADALATGTGYWFKSYEAPAESKLDVVGSPTPITVSHAEGCASANGCVAVTVQTVSGSNRYNLVGNPFPYPVDWANVRIRVGGSAVYTPSEAAGYGANALDPPALSNQIWIWNGNSYDTYSDTIPTDGQLPYFTAFWVNVLPGAYGLSVELLIPAQPATGALDPAATGNVAARGRPPAIAWLDWLVPTAAADGALPDETAGFDLGRGPEDRPARGWARKPAVEPAPTAEDADFELRVTEGIWSWGLSPEAAAREARTQVQAEGREWYVRLKVDEPATGFKDHNTVFGQLSTALDGPDRHDLIELPPYAAPWLTLVFPRPAWGDRAGDYASDFRSAKRLNPRGRVLPGLPAADWTFEVRADRTGTPVVLSWEGSPEVLKRSRLIDHATGATLRPAAFPAGYATTLETGTRAFTWRFLGNMVPTR